VLLSADDAVSKTPADGDWPLPLPLLAAGSSGIMVWARVVALPAVTGLVVPESGRAPASGLGLPISSAGYGRALSSVNEADKEAAGNGVEAAGAEGVKTDAEDDVGSGEAGSGEDASDDDGDEPDSHSAELQVVVPQEKASASSSSAAPAGGTE
jgi:hypothetical protein